MSISSSSDFEDENSWVLELETVLLENCDFFKLRSICRDRAVPNHLRHEVWKICLNVKNHIDSLDNFNDVFDLPNQELVHDCCCEFVASLPKELSSNSIGFINDIESILTYFSRKYCIQFEKDNGWLFILRVLCCELKLLNRNELYAFFTAICHRFLPSKSVIHNEIFSVFRLLLQYHDPKLCSFLDTHKLFPHLYAYDWFSSIFSCQMCQDVLVRLWDVYFLISDPFLMFYLSLIVVLNLKETLLELQGSEKSLILSKIKSVLPQLTPDDIEDFISLARHYTSITPKSFTLKFSSILFGNGNKDKEIQMILESLCMPVSVHELLESKNADFQTNSINYFLVDCRPADQYNAGHLPSAYFFDSSLIISSPTKDFQTAVDSLLQTQQQALESKSESAGEHVCFLGSGNPDEDQIINMVIAQFLQRQTKYVSLVSGGFKMIHDVLGPQCDNFFVGHDVSQCIVCGDLSNNSSTAGEPNNNNYINIHHLEDNELVLAANESGSKEGKSMSNLLKQFSGALKTSSSMMKDKLKTYVVKTSDGKMQQQQQNPLKGLQHYDQESLRNAKSYRNTGNKVFSIFESTDDIDDGSLLIEQPNASLDSPHTAQHPEMINLDVWMRKPDVLQLFDCSIVDEDNVSFPGFLMLTKTILFVLKKSASSKLDVLNAFLGRNNNVDSIGSSSSSNMVSIYRRRHLSTVQKITSRKKIPELLTFYYGTNDGGSIRDRYLIKQCSEAAKAIKVQIQKVLDEQDKSD